MDVPLRWIRVSFAVLLLLMLMPSGYAFITTGERYEYESKVGETVANDRPGTTVIAADAHGGGTLAAVGPNGTLVYFNDTYDAYHDVDKAPDGQYTVEYIAHENIPAPACAGGTGTGDPCYRTVIERVNLSTGDVTRLYSVIRPNIGSAAAHDFDRVDEETVLIAEIGTPDRIRLVNTTTGITTWTWEAQSDVPLSSGGFFPGDWTHLNDVELLADGRVMVSLRNQDQVVFLDRETGLIESWTLGEDDAHGTLHEQHNPDYINESNGGPAVLVADSENSRILEYQRDGDSWERSWVWSDSQMQWARDADRLPNGHTLITDTHGDRVLEVDPEGEVVWSMAYPGGYDSERLDTPIESRQGPSATAANLQSDDAGETPRESSSEQSVLAGVVDLFPSLVVNGALYLLPNWFTPISVVGLFGGIVVVLAWGVAEFVYSPYSVTLRLHRSES